MLESSIYHSREKPTRIAFADDHALMVEKDDVDIFVRQITTNEVWLNGINLLVNEHKPEMVILKKKK